LEAETLFFLACAFRNIAVLRPRATGGWIAVEDHVLDFLREFVEGRIEIESVGVGCEFQRALENCGSGARAETTVEKWTTEVVKNLAWIEIVLGAEAVAGRACSIRRIEAEGTRL